MGTDVILNDQWPQKQKTAVYAVVFMFLISTDRTLDVVEVLGLSLAKKKRSNLH